ncbi:AraC family transcriptional regulator [Sphingobacterium spiritivorum]|uniref:AraC family transcriptional regulator n=1 Tax=Sphingobacterium spiritivorum TaxID=258 RepID=UPI0036C3AF7F
MDKQMDNIPVYDISMFNADCTLFWMETLERCSVRNLWLRRPHKQRFCMLLYLTKASGVVRIDNTTIQSDHNETVICSTPNSVNSIKLEPDSTGFIIAFTEDFFSLRFNSNILYQFSFFKENGNCFFGLSKQDESKWSSLSGLMLQEFSGGKGDIKVLRSYLNILLHEIEGHTNVHIPSLADGHAHDKVMKFQKLLERNFIQHKSPSYYADKLNITLHYLNKLCKICRGMTSGQIIKERILTESKRLLKHTTLSIAEIGYELGFESPSYFITFFKKNIGYTPESYRRSVN